jgi:two-component system, NtrC family, response regulator AtoC
MNSSHPNEADLKDANQLNGELRAFVATRLGGLSWVVDLIPNYEISIGRAITSDIRVDSPQVIDRHATLSWTGEQVLLTDLGSAQGVLINGEPVVGTLRVSPGDEIEIGPAALVVNITLAPASKNRRSLTHNEFIERVNEELARVGRNGRHTCLMMLKSKSGDGSRLAAAALSTLRGGDIVGTYAHDEIEFLLPDTPPNIARAVVERLIETAAAEGAHVGLAVAPEDGVDTERLMRAGRDALAKSMRTGETIARSGDAPPAEALIELTPHTQATKLVVDAVTAAALSDESLLLMGEPNTGKRFYARLFHEKSTRKNGPLVAIQCGGLVDAEAIAHAFGKEGGQLDMCLAETARGGTLLLDEVGDLPFKGQRQLLKLLQEGSEDYTVVATTHRDLQSLCQVGAFSRELYEKISRKRVTVPALRMRGESIVPLARNFAEQFQSDKPVKLSHGAIERMRSYAWPGNVLELRNAMERAITLADGGELLAEHLPGDATDTGEGRLREHVGSVERDAIIKALADNNYNQTHAARLLGISRRALIYKMEKYGLKPPPAGARSELEEET